MAIDTERKRRSTLGPWGSCRVLPVPDGTISLLDRVNVWLYGAIAAAAGGDGGGVGGYTTPGVGEWNAYQQFIIVDLPALIFPRR